MTNENRRATAESLIEGLSPNERTRFDSFANKCRLIYAQNFGKRVPDMVWDDVIARSILTPEGLEIVHGSEVAGSIENIALNLAAEDEIVNRALAYADKEAKETIRTDILANMNPHRKMAMQRAGDLSDYLNKEVDIELERRLTARTAL